MKNLNPKPFIFILLIFSGIVWFGLAIESKLNMQNFYEFMSLIPKVVTVDLIFIWLFIKWFWKFKFLQGWLIPFPNLNGTWQGQIQTNWKDNEGKTLGPINVILTIRQTFGRISCVMRTNEMESHSYLEGFCIDFDGQIRRLCYSYTSRPKTSLRERSTPHDGTILFNIIGNPVTKLDGEYWTQRNTTGSIVLTFRTKELLEEFPEELLPQPINSK